MAPNSLNTYTSSRALKAPAAMALRMKVTAASLALAGLLALAVSAPRVVAIALATLLLTGLAVAGVVRGVVALVDRQMRPVGTMTAAGATPPAPAGWRA